MLLDVNAPKVVAQKGSSVSALRSVDKTQITVVACISAAGFCAPDGHMGQKNTCTRANSWRNSLYPPTGCQVTGEWISSYLHPV